MTGMRTLTRRVVLGGGAVAVGGTAALVAGQTDRGRRWLHQVGIVDGPDLVAPNVRAEVERHVLRSAAMGRDVAWRMYVPTGSAEAVMLCLHGRNATSDYAFDAIGVHRFVVDAGLPWAVVGVDGGASSYWHARADGTDPPRMLFDELLPVVGDRFGPTPLLLLGWSMGGYGALLSAAQRPEAVAAVAASSPAVWRRLDGANGGAFDGEDDFKRNDLRRYIDVLDRISVRFDCGRDDPFIANVRALAEDLPHAQRNFGAGFHDAATWRSYIPEQLRFFASTIAG
jgi:enterochelin esterase-like enzyme